MRTILFRDRLSLPAGKTGLLPMLKLEMRLRGLIRNPKEGMSLSYFPLTSWIYG